MPERYETDGELREVTDEEVYDAVRYLEPDARERNEYDDSTAFAICLSVVILFLGFIAYIWLYP